ncbi:MAG: lipoate--protein ligase family protein [Betaproteobacteria bacterium]|nr:lipoate--protein ligase family protein [Betaproteobacteria bacterium]
MSPTWRVLDTGVREAAENIALNRALLDALASGEAPPTLRFLRFRPCALLGFHQSVDQELDLDYCRAQGIAVSRRITGGGAIYCDEAQLGWELYAHKRDFGHASLAVISERICQAAVAGIRTLGVDAAFRPRNDIEVDGRKISGTGGIFEGDALLYQGTLLIEFDIERMLRVLKIPAEKLSDKAIASARDRVSSLKDILGSPPALPEVKARLLGAFEREFGVSGVEGTLNRAERGRLEQTLAEIDGEDWVRLIDRPTGDQPLHEAWVKTSGGLLRARARFDVPSGRLKQVWFTGDFFISPRRTVADLEAALRDTALEGLEARIEAFFEGRGVDMLGLRPADFAWVVRAALEAPALAPGTAA